MPSRLNRAENIYSSLDFSALIEILKDRGREIIISKGLIIRPSLNEILFILDGEIVIQDDNEIAIGQSFPLMPVGLLETYYSETQLHYKAESQVKAISINIDVFNELSALNQEITQLLFKIISYMLISVVHVYYEVNTDTRYSVIRNMIYRYNIRTENNTLKEQNLSTFILNRTKLSRSYIFKILSDLRVGGYITIERGKLISINKHIPERY
ncbi:helix-turn-helix domain-containing protein [Klebsiella aerogenes]